MRLLVVSSGFVAVLVALLSSLSEAKSGGRQPWLASSLRLRRASLPSPAMSRSPQTGTHQPAMGPAEGTETELIPVDSASFDEIREDGKVYVDKTSHIYEVMMKPQLTYCFLVRPRRFGKSLLCSTIANMFGGKKAEPLFKGLWIAESGVWDFKKEAAPVIHLDMSSVADIYAETFNSNLRYTLLRKASLFGIDTTGMTSLSNGRLFAALLDELHLKSGKKVVVIIDEYDKPILDLLTEPQEIEGVRKSLQTFYAILKSSEEHLRLVFITGLYKFSQTSMFSTLNNLRDLSLRMNAANIAGFTEDEIREYYPQSLEKLRIKENIESIDKLMNDLRQLYNGYVFGVDDAEVSGSVYNPFAINCVLDDLSMKTDYWGISGSNVLIYQQMTKDNTSLFDPSLYKIQHDELISSTPVNEMSVQYLMYYGGYLTAEKIVDNDVYLKIPNHTIQRKLASGFLNAFFKPADKMTPFAVHAGRIKSFLMNTNFDTIVSEANTLSDLINAFYAGVSYMQFKGEKTYHLALQFALNVMFDNVHSEELTNCGRIDLSVETDKRIFIFELKYNESSELALKQIQQKGYSRKFEMRRKPIVCIGLNFITKPNGKESKNTEYNIFSSASIKVENSN